MGHETLLPNHHRQQALETRLLEVPVRGEGFSDARVRHDHKAGAVHLPPGLIGTVGVQGQGVGSDFGRHGHNAELWAALEPPERFDK